MSDTASPATGTPHAPAEQELCSFALALPEAEEHFPWGERVIKVRGKIFLFLSVYQEKLVIGVKLPQSRDFALDLPNAAPTGYNLGKSGWVTLRYGVEDVPDLARLRHWIIESYTAIAPKKLSAGLIPSA